MARPQMLSRFGRDIVPRLGALARDLTELERALAELPRGDGLVPRAAQHLLDRGGKRLRPLCVVLASRVGTGFDDRARHLAVAVELVHAATLLHDDVVDVASLRRGQLAARVLYGNAASIFAGDWLLIEALRQIGRAGVDGLVDDMLDVIDQMIAAESAQLERRGTLTGTRADYFRIAEGKTAALFRWALRAGGRVGGLGDDECAALDRYGLHLGVAFQVVDDLLDVDGDAAATGKQLFADLREGKLSCPLVVALERDPALAPQLERCIGAGGTDGAVADVLEALRHTGALAECRRLASWHVSQAIAALAELGGGDGVAALFTVAEAIVHRED